MLQIISYPGSGEIDQLIQRPSGNAPLVTEMVQEILGQVKEHGDSAVKKYMALYDKAVPENLLVDGEEWLAADSLENSLKEAIGLAFENISKFHAIQRRPTDAIETMDGVRCWRKQVPISKVGLYIPGGSAPLFSTLMMLGIPATLAGCRDIVVCTPAQENGKIHPAILYVARKAGIGKIYKAGGVQAIAAMAYGTETIPAVYKIFGPGNGYVTAAKQEVQSEGIAIDMPAGPSEVAIIADHTADAAFVAADLIAQAEHGPDSQVLLVSTDIGLIENVIEQIELQAKSLPRRDIAANAMQNSKAILVNNIDEGMDIVNRYAPEHLIINAQEAISLAEKVENAGSVFIGNYTPESVGDYASGTNHTLPTNGYAKGYSGISVDSFMKNITYQQLTADGLVNIGPGVVEMAMAEGLKGHAEAVMIRLNALDNYIKGR